MSTTFINLPSPQQPDPASGPGTPMSGISTIAIKDGHEGSRPSADGGADRVQRLMGYFDEREARSAKMIDGMTYDEGVVDTTDRAPKVVSKEKEKEKDKDKEETNKKEDETMGGTGGGV